MFVAACVAMLAAAVAVQAMTPAQCMAGAARRDCGYFNSNDCTSHGCCWIPVPTAQTAHLSAEELESPPMHMLEGGTPWCFAPQSIVGGYAVAGVQPFVPSPAQRPGWQLSLKLADGNNYFGADVALLQVQVVFETKQRLRVKISNPLEARWEVPESLLPLAPGDSSLMRVEDAFYSFSYTSFPFGFAVTRVDDGEVVFNSTAPAGPDGFTPLFNGLVFTDQYLELSTSLPGSPVLYGLGEKVTSMQLATQGKPVTFWARDAATPVDQNIYGSHPFYLEHRRTAATAHELAARPDLLNDTQTTKTHGAWLRNSNGMDVLIHDAQSAVREWQLNHPGVALDERAAAAYSTGYLTYRVIGGVLDFFVYVGSTATGTSSASAIIQQYHTSVGLPHMPPFWALGWAQCRWGYHSLAEVQAMVAAYATAALPLDHVWTDIDYMGSGAGNPYEDFTTDPVNFPANQMATFIQQLHKQGQRYVLIIDPAIHNRTGYGPFDSGLQQDVFIKQASGATFIGKVWPGYTAFPTFHAPQTSVWWAGQIAAFRDQVPVDGIWIDMNEASNFCTGDCDSPTALAHEAEHPRLQRMRAVEAAEAIAAQKKSGRHTRSHSHSIATQSVAKSPAPAPKGFRKPEPKSLCTGAPGAPRGTCLPNNPPYRINNAATGADLNTLTIDMDAVHSWNTTSLLEYDVHNLYGFSEAVATNAALESQMGTRSLVLSRSTFSGSGHHTAHWLGDNWSTWESMAASIPGVLAMQFFGVPLVGADICGFNGDTTEELCARWMALGSFYPFARNHNSKGQISQEPYVWDSVAAVSQKTLSVRYSLLHLYNTLFFQAHSQGGTVARPLFLNFAQDPNTFPIGAQFMIGSALLVTPVLTQGATTVWGYFPQTNDAGQPQRWFDLWSGTEFFAGSNGTGDGWAEIPAPLDTIPLHLAGGNVVPVQTPALTTVAQASNPFELLVVPDSADTATGSLFIDDGETLQIGTNSLQASFSYAKGTLTYALSVNTYAPAGKLVFEEVSLMGVAAAPSGATVNGQAVPAAKLQYDAQLKVVTLDSMALPLNQPFTINFAF